MRFPLVLIVAISLNAGWHPVAIGGVSLDRGASCAADAEQKDDETEEEQDAGNDEPECE